MSFSQKKVHAKIPPLLSLCHEFSPGAKEWGEVMWPSPPLSFATHLLRYRHLSLPVVLPSISDSSSQEIHFAGLTGGILAADAFEDRSVKGSVVGDMGSLGCLNRSEALPRTGSIGPRIVQCGEGLRTLDGGGRLRRRRGRRLLMMRRLLLLGRLLGRLLRCFLRCHEYSTPFQFQKW